jgi:hypothetical protein
LTKYEVVSNSRRVHHFPVGTIVRLVRRANPPRNFAGDTNELPSLYTGVVNGESIQQWLNPDEVKHV